MGFASVRPGSFWLLAVTALIVLGCGRAPQARFPHAESVLSRLQEQSACSRAVSGEARLELKGPFVDVTGRLLFKAQAPDRLRFDLYSPLGVTISTLTTQGEKFSLYDLPSARFFSGPSTACNLARFTRVQIPPEALVELLRGRPPVLEHEPEQKGLRFARPWFSESKYVVSIDGDHEARQWLTVRVAPEDYDLPLDKQRLRLTRVVLRQGGRLVYEVKLSAHRRVQRAQNELSTEERAMGIPPVPSTGPPCDAELPHVVSFNVGRGGYRLDLLASELWHNPPDVPAAYRQQPPGGVRREWSECGLAAD